MPTNTINRGYPYPIDTDAIDTAGDEGRFATSVDADVQLLHDAHARQQPLIDANQADVAFLYNSRVRTNTLSVSQFHGPMVDCRIYLLTTDWAGNSNFTFAAPFVTLPVMMCQGSMESAGIAQYGYVVPWKQYTTTVGGTVMLTNTTAAAWGNTAFRMYALAIGTWG